MKEIKRIGVFTSGGDCSGLNAIISSVVRTANGKGIEVYGIYDGTDGLFYPNLKYTKLEMKDLQNNFSYMRSGGTFLKSKNRDGGITNTAEKNKEAFKKGVDELKLDSLIVIGGDGSAMIVSELVEGTDINVICIPKLLIMIHQLLNILLDLIQLEMLRWKLWINYKQQHIVIIEQ